jgi:hypothetical protein
MGKTTNYTRKSQKVLEGNKEIDAGKNTDRQ